MSARVCRSLSAASPSAPRRSGRAVRNVIAEYFEGIHHIFKAREVRMLSCFFFKWGASHHFVKVSAPENEVDEQPITSLPDEPRRGMVIRLRRARRADAHRCDPFMSHTHCIPCATLVAWRTEWMITLGCSRKLFRSRPSCGEGAILCGRAVRLSGSILTAPSALDSIHASNQAFCCRAAVGLLSGFAVVLSGFCCRAVRPLSGCCQVLLSCCQVGAQPHSSIPVVI